MKYIYIYIIVLLSFIFSFAQNNTQMTRYGFEVNTRPQIYYNTFVSYQNGLNLLFSINLQNDILQFKKEGEKYRAKYDISINLKGIKGQQPFFSESWNEKVEVSDFKVTNSKLLYQTSKRAFPIQLKPGKYKLFVEVTDSQTGNTFFSNRTINVRNQNESQIKFSQPVLIEDNQDLSDSFDISSYQNIVEFSNSAKVLIEYASDVQDTLQINSKIIKLLPKKKETIRTKNYKLIPQSKYQNFVETIDNAVFEEGQYIFGYNFKQSQNEMTIQDTINVIWYDKPTYLYKTDLAVRPMVYILPLKEFERVEDLSMDELEVWFKDYWKKKDDKPETAINEVQYEFYHRVQKSIQKFSLRFKEGWRTERGEALILYGEPTRIDKHHHGIDTNPYEIWYYDNLNKKITFVDKYNNEDFKLVNIENIKED